MGKEDCWIQTYSGIKFHPFNPIKQEINWEDIAHALSNICRFTGHYLEFYSVAQHCVLCAENVSLKNALWALLHDAPEAYINDVARPLKIQPQFDFYNDVESKIMNTICECAEISRTMPEEVKIIDRVLLKTEARDLALLSPEWNMEDIIPLKGKIEPWQPKEAKQRFLDKFDLLYYFGGKKS